jgi:hypothetical protein
VHSRCTTQWITEYRLRMLHEAHTRNVGLLIKGGKEIGKIWRHARALESRTRRNMSSSTFLLMFGVCSILLTFLFNIFSPCALVKRRFALLAWPDGWPWPRYMAILAHCFALYTAGTRVWRTVIHVWYPCHVRPTSAWEAAFNSRNQPWLALQKWHKFLP